MTDKNIPDGTLHRLPADFRRAIKSGPTATSLNRVSVCAGRLALALRVQGRWESPSLSASGLQTPLHLRRQLPLRSASRSGPGRGARVLHPSPVEVYSTSWIVIGAGLNQCAGGYRISRFLCTSSATAFRSA